MTGEAWPEEVRAFNPVMAGQDRDGDWWCVRPQRSRVGSRYKWETIVLLMHDDGSFKKETLEDPSTSMYVTFEDAWRTLDQWDVVDIY